jgi:hypothetical protein
MSGSDHSRPELDRELRDSFTALRRQEEAGAPEFDVLSERAARRRQPRGASGWFRPLAIAAATAAVAGAALVVASAPWLRTHVPQAAPSLRPGSSITAWRPATDFLLRTPGQEVLTWPPAFGRAFSIGIELGLGSTAADRRERQRRP